MAPDDVASSSTPRKCKSDENKSGGVLRLLRFLVSLSLHVRVARFILSLFSSRNSNSRAM